MPDPTPAVFDANYAGSAHEVLAELRERCPVTATRTARGRAVWLLTRDEDVRRAFVDPRLTVSDGPSPAAPPPRRATDVTLMNQAPADHARLRRLATPALTPQRVEAYRPVVEAIAHRLVDDLEQRLRHGPVDLMRRLARPLPFHVQCEVFGVPADARDDLHGWMAALFDRAGRPADEPQQAMDRIDAFMRTEVTRRLAEPGTDLVSDITTAWTTGGDATEDEVVSLCAMLLLAGYDSTIHGIGIGTLGLLTTPGLLTRVRDHPELVPSVVEELLRWDTPGPFSTPRRATADLVYGGHVVPAGATVLLAIAAANRDPRRHPQPDEVDVDRARSTHLAFGLGAHYCLGATLARLELAVTLTTLTQRLPALAMAVPSHQLTWRGNHTHRRLDTLPVRLRH